MIDTVLLDTSVIGYLIYHSWYGQQTMEEYVRQCVDTYEKIPFYFHPCKTLLWVGDSKPYFRKLITRSYKGSRPDKEKDLDNLMSILEDYVKPLRYPHFEADDIIALYVKSNPLENIMIFSVDSDLLQLLREPIFKTWEGYLFSPLKRVSPSWLKDQTKVQGEVIWCCAKGYEPQLRSLTDGTFQTWFENKLCYSKKKLSHLDINNPRSIVDWKVIMGDTSDTISPGEENRWMIDLLNPPVNWVLSAQYPEFLEDFQKNRKIILHDPHKYKIYSDFHKLTNSTFPTAKAWEQPRVIKQWKKLQSVSSKV